MKNLPAPAHIYVSKSAIAGAGRGVFAGADFREGETIEACPVIELPRDDASHLNDSILVTYIYYLGARKDMPVLALGFGSLYNHSDTPNARYHGRERDGCIDFIATRPIRTGEEITVNYSPGRKSGAHPLWFAAPERISE